jgi:hypothetical protein
MAPISLDSTAAKAFEDEMRLTFAEKRIIDLKKQLCAEYERAQKAERRAEEAKESIPNADPDVMRAMRQQLLLANEEKEAALAARDKAIEEAKQARLESKHLREELQKSQPTIEKLTADLHEARSSRPTLDHTAVNQLHTTITARDAGNQAFRCAESGQQAQRREPVLSSDEREAGGRAKGSEYETCCSRICSRSVPFPQKRSHCFLRLTYR